MALERIAELATKSTGILGLWARRLDTGETLAYQADEEFPAASTIKLPILYELFSQVEKGILELSAPLEVQPDDIVPGSGVLKDLSPGIKLSVRDLAVLMIVVSDNTATNMLIDLIGQEAVNMRMSALGLPGIRLENKLFRGLPGRSPNRATPAALGALLERIVRRETLSPRACDEMLAILTRQHFKEHITRFLPQADAFIEEGSEAPILVASKSGEIRGTRNEVGAVWAQGKCYVIAMMSKGIADRRFYSDNEGSLLLARASLAVYEHFIQAR